jgi:hypothetical protein
VLRARNNNVTVFERLSKGLQCGSRVFREFIKKKDAVMCKANLSRVGWTSASDEGNTTCGMMRCAKRAIGSDDIRCFTCETVHFCDRKPLFIGEVW